MLSAVLTSDSVLNSIRKELKKMKEGLRVSVDEIGEIITSQIIKREVLENSSTSEALSMLKKANRKVARDSAKKRESKSNVDIALEEIEDDQERKAG